MNFRDPNMEGSRILQKWNILVHYLKRGDSNNDIHLDRSNIRLKPFPDKLFTILSLGITAR